jgi:hypothetical protein
MPAIAYAAFLFVGAVAGLVGFATVGVRELKRDSAAERERARRLALLLAQRRGEFVSFFLNDGKSVAGRVAYVDADNLLIHIDIRRQKRDPDGRLQQPDEVPQVSNLSGVDLTQVDHVEHVTEDYGDVDTEYGD